jgi:hypothetical protein
MALASPLSAFTGAFEEFQRLQGQTCGATLTVTPLCGVSRFALSSTARLKSVVEELTTDGVHA